MLASIVHIVNGDWACLVESLIDMDVITPGVNTRRFTLDLEYALGEVKLINGIPDIEFTNSSLSIKSFQIQPKIEDKNVSQIANSPQESS
jgi:hypothetical protein